MTPNPILLGDNLRWFMDIAHMDDEERLRRWRLVLGGESADGTGYALSGRDAEVDRALSLLYGDGQPGSSPRGGSGASAPWVARWLGDIRSYFPNSVVRMMQKDALERLNLQQMLLEPEMLAAVEPDIHLVTTLLSLNRVMPDQTRATARQVVAKVVRELEQKLRRKTEQAIQGSLNRAARNNRRPRYNEMDWDRTIRANLKHYQPDYKTIVPERRIGFGRRQARLRDILLCVDQSGSMGTSVVYSGLFGAVMASMRSLRTQMIVFDTAVVDLSERLSDPVDLLFGTQLGGGTDIARALAYCQTRISRPEDTIMVLITDLYEGGNRKAMLERAHAILASGVQLIVLLALSDQGTPSYDSHNAQAFTDLGAPVFACTPDLFPDLMAAAINRADLSQWAATHLSD
jgi:Mg-chelatase subunit ChlD